MTRQVVSWGNMELCQVAGCNQPAAWRIRHTPSDTVVAAACLTHKPEVKATILPKINPKNPHRIKTHPTLKES